MTDILPVLSQFVASPTGQGVLAAIRAGEGTPGADGYRTMFGGGLFDDLSRHPDKVISKNGYDSAAAGAYQFLPETYYGAAKALGLKDFSPRSQDLAAAYLINRRTQAIGGVAGVQKRGFDSEVSNLLAPEWASLPTKNGKSYYGQPVKKLEELQDAFAKGSRGLATQGGPSTQAGQEAASGDNDEMNMLKRMFGGGGDSSLQGLSLASLDVPGLGAAGAMGGTKFAGAAAPLLAALPMLYSQDPEASRLAGYKLQNALADQQLISAHKGLAAASMPEAFQVPDASSGMMQAMANFDSQDDGRSAASAGANGAGGLNVIEYLTGDKDHPGYRDDHGGSNYHEHLAFKTKEQRDAAMERLKAAGIQIGSVNDGRHAKGSYHYQDLAFDIPAAQVPVGKEQELSRRVRSILGMR